MQQQYEALLVGQYFTIVVLSGLLGLSVVYFLWRMGKTGYAHFHEKEKIRFDYQQQQLEEHERIMEQMSYEIHEVWAHEASVMHLMLDEARKLAGDPRVDKILGSATQSARKLIADARMLTRLLNGDFIVSQGLENMVQRTMEFCGLVDGKNCQFSVRGQLKKMPDQTKLLTYRIAQEAITNLKRHAQATFATIEISLIDGRFLMSITDNGKGFDLEKASGSGIGIKNMLARASQLRGKLTVLTAKGKGTTIELLIESVLRS